MKTVKQTALRIFFAVEIVVFACVYVFGPQGMQVLQHMQQENIDLEKNIQVLRVEIKELEDTVIAWKIYPFYKEKIAREQLQMARKSDQVYYLT
jgi:cell division protein FtsB